MFLSPLWILFLMQKLYTATPYL